MKSKMLLLWLFLVLSCSLTFLGGCEQQETSSALTSLASPKARAWTAALQFKNQNPSARVFFSQRTGETFWVDGGGQALQQGVSLATDAYGTKALATVGKFLERYPDLFGVATPSKSFHVVQDGFRTLPAEQGGLYVLRFDQLSTKGYPVRGKFGLAIFNAAGGLISLQGQLVPSSELVDTTPTGTNVSNFYHPKKKRTGRLVLERTGEKTYRALEERVEKFQYVKRRTLVDDSGKVVKTWIEAPHSVFDAPEGWVRDGSLGQSSARDSLGVTTTIPSTEVAQTLVMGFRLPDIHAAGEAVWISDLGNSADRVRIPQTALATDAGSWADEPDYDLRLRDATRLAQHLETVLRWYKDQHGYASWDGKGSSFRAAIRGNLNFDKSEPDFNAYGNNGHLLVGDGHSPTGQPITDALDVVGHEFTHSVVDATVGFYYLGESGALSESLADIFGESVAGFSSTVYAQDSGMSCRDLLNPESFGQPTKYSEYLIMSDMEDSGGVHTNSGIMNRALSQVILGANGKAGVGSIALTSLLLDSLRLLPYAPDGLMEDFAAGLSAYCLARKNASGLGHLPSNLCSLLEENFAATELLNFHPETTR